MTWTIDYTRAARREMNKIPQDIRRRVKRYMDERIAPLDNPRTMGRPLVSGRWEGFWRYRVGTYRVICDIDDGARRVTIATVGRRDEVY